MRGTSFSLLPELSAKAAAAHPDVPPPRNWALGPRLLLPVGHVVEVLRELGQVGALLLVLLFCPKQNLRNLKKEADWMGLEPSGFPVTGQFLSFRDKQPSPRPFDAIPLFYKRAQHPAVSAARLFHGCENHARSPAWKTEHEMSGAWTGRGSWAGPALWPRS